MIVGLSCEADGAPRTTERKTKGAAGGIGSGSKLIEWFPQALAVADQLAAKIVRSVVNEHVAGMVTDSDTIVTVRILDAEHRALFVLLQLGELTSHVGDTYSDYVTVERGSRSHIDRWRGVVFWEVQADLSGLRDLFGGKFHIISNRC
ncbi:MAG: hypothetical protein NXH72_08980 [Hyphomonadaceae bacterium]|nr:hypothetical protein [Hyphomonadaceae bacterium]